MAPWGDGTASPGRGGCVSLRDPLDIEECLATLSAEVEDEVCSFYTGHPAPEAHQSGSALDLLLLRRGVELRMVCLEAFHRDASVAAHLAHSVDSGLQIRTVPGLPSKVLIFDRRGAIVPGNLEDASDGALVVRHPATVHLLHGIFETHWRRADRVCGVLPPRSDAGPRPMELAVLNLLALGYKDDAIARQTGQSARTVRRVVAGLCDSLGARSRFDLALRASARGWVDSPVA